MDAFLTGIFAAAAVLFGCLTLAYILAHLLARRRTVWHPDQKVHYRRCEDCTGGVQVLRLDLGNGVWGPIPQEWNMTQKDGYGFGTFEPPVASKRSCETCHGIGKVNFVASDVKLPDRR